LCQVAKRIAGLSLKFFTFMVTGNWGRVGRRIPYSKLMTERACWERIRSVPKSARGPSVHKGNREKTIVLREVSRHISSEGGGAKKCPPTVGPRTG